MDKLYMEYVGSRTPDGMGQDWEHVKYFWGPENNWKCEVPVLLAGALIQDFGVDKFLPCANPTLGNVEELQDKIIKLEKEKQALLATIEKLKAELVRTEKISLKSPQPEKKRKK